MYMLASTAIRLLAMSLKNTLRTESPPWVRKNWLRR